MTEPKDREPRDASDRGARPSSLDAAIAATRRAFDGENALAPSTERRILQATRTRRGFRPGTWLIPLAAAFAASAAVAQSFGGFGALRVRLFGQPAPVPPVASSVAPSRVAPPAAVRADSAPLPAPPPVPSVPAKAPAVSEAPGPRAAAPRVEPAPHDAPGLRPAPGTEPPVPPNPPKLDEMALYREAHRAHFVERNYAVALSHWDRYLAFAPRGAFALEARYNRGVALYRLGRREAAREALRPFADGAYGGYRVREAAHMLEELR